MGGPGTGSDAAGDARVHYIVNQVITSLARDNWKIDRPAALERIWGGDYDEAAAMVRPPAWGLSRS